MEALKWVYVEKDETGYDVYLKSKDWHGSVTQTFLMNVKTRLEAATICEFWDKLREELE